jgi:hypothetical protein
MRNAFPHWLGVVPALSRRQSHMREETERPIFSRPSFETPAFGGLLRMRAVFRGKFLILMVRSVALATRLEPRGHEASGPEQPYAIALPLRAGWGASALRDMRPLDCGEGGIARS